MNILKQDNQLKLWVYHSLFCIKMLNAKVFIPDKYVVICCHNVRMQKPLGIPPRTNAKT